MGYMSRKPNSNEAPSSTTNPWGGDEYYDDFCLLLNGLAKRCADCKRVIKHKYLDDKSKCPDCRAVDTPLP